MTSGYTDYLHSSSALRLVVVHGLLYYTLAVVLYSVVLDTKWTVIDSLYFATVLVRVTCNSIPVVVFECVKVVLRWWSRLLCHSLSLKLVCVCVCVCVWHP